MSAERAPQRFWAAVEKTDTCWLWTKATRGGGYGAFWMDGAHRPAHRVSYTWAKGPIPDGLVIDHLCRVRTCVNPDHLEAVTNYENVVARGVGPSAKAARATRCVNGHAFDEANTHIKKDGSRHCRACSREAWHRRAAS